MIEVAMIGIGKMGFHVVTFWMGGEGIRDSMMRFGMTCRIGGDAIRETMICFGTSAENFAISSALFIAISFISSGCQKKVYSDSVFGSGDVDDVVTFDGVATSFIFSASGIQKKDRSEMDFV